MQRKLIIIDGFNLIFRCFYAVPPMHTREGLPTNALFGYAKALIRMSQSDAAYIVVAFDSGGETFRSEVDENYKAHRDGMPSDLINQMDPIFAITDLLQIPWMTAPGFEADDIIGTLVRAHEKQLDSIQIVSSDKDLFQFIGGVTTVYDAMKMQEYDHAEAVKKFGVNPNQIVDYLALIGDTSDNIPGVKGIGPKTAIKLLETYGTLESILEHLSELSPKNRELIGDGESARKSQFLATIRTDVPLSVDILSHARLVSGVDFTPELMHFLRSYEFSSLIPSHLVTVTPPFSASALEITDTLRSSLLARIESDTPYSFALSESPLTTFALAFSETEVYIGDMSRSSDFDLLKQLIHAPHAMTTYDWKKSIRAILMYQNAPSQSSLFG